MKLGSSFFKISKHNRFDYRPRYAEEKTTSDAEDKVFDFKNGEVRQKTIRSRISGSFRSNQYIKRPIATKSRRNYKLILLAITMIVIYIIYKYDVHPLISLGMILLPLVLFIRETNKL